MKVTEVTARASTAVDRSQAARLVGTIACIGLLVWLLSKQSWGAVLDVIGRADGWPLTATVPLIVLNMLLRSMRWRALLGSAREVPLRLAFCAQMIGYLANNVLPVRLGDLVRVYLLGDLVTVSRSRILSTVLLERLLDMAMVVFLLAVAMIFNPLPSWIRVSAAVAALATFGGVAAVTVVAIYGARAVGAATEMLPLLSTQLKDRLETWSAEFSSGVERIAQPEVAVTFFGGTLVIWATEILLIIAVGSAFALKLTLFDAGVLMLFSLFSSFIPALPGQIGTFEFAIVSGLEFLGRNSTAALPFGVVLHLVLLAGTTVLGVICLLGSGLPLLPKRFIESIRAAA